MTITIQQAIDTIIATVPGAPFPKTVDTIKLGDPARPLTGILLTFITTVEAIEQAAQLGANLIITHEPTFYNHPDDTTWLAQNLVYAAKRQLIEQQQVVIWRFHDYLHRRTPDSTVMSLLQELGWEAYALPDQPYLCRIPPMTLRDLGLSVKERLAAGMLRVVGDLDFTCQTIGVLPGFVGVEKHIDLLERPDVDAIITGEIHEWETSEYVRDAVRLGYKKGLIITGHAASEELGMKWYVPWLQ